MPLENRIKLFVNQNSRAVIVVLAVAGILFLVGAGYVFTNPATGTVTEDTNQQQVSTDVSTRAFVSGESSLYEQDLWIENRSAYFISSAPELTLDLNTTVPPDQEVTVSHELEMETVGLRDGQPFHSSVETLLSSNYTATNGSVNSSTTIDVEQLREDIQTKESETQGVGQFEIRLRMNTTYSTDDYDGSLTATTPLVISGEAYYLGGSLSESRTHSTVVQRTVQQPSSPLVYGGLSVLSLILFGLCGVVSSLKDSINSERMRTQIIHSRHDEWISRGEFPTNSDRQYISILTLGDLVDVAIDTNKRVIYDPDIETYAVIDTEEIYYYAIDRESTDNWLDI
ncbi:DUF5305 domain-containing protein [Natrinema sp. H-ect4]|uniref:DUF5305 domain-containing protein n=1 Tax=Natrinema sp. H-ect4 TaxID=3242699 RepID=UPI0035A92107